jgi:hypothetical protein
MSCGFSALSRGASDDCHHIPCESRVNTQLKPNSQVRFVEIRKKNKILGDDAKVVPGMKCGFDTGGYQPIVYSTGVHNELRAVVNRALAPTPVPDPAVLPRVILNMKRLFRKIITKNSIKDSVPWEEYISRTGSSPSVKAVLQKAHDELQQSGELDLLKLGHGRSREWTRRGGFVKVENNLYSTPIGTTWKDPRLIQSAQPKFMAIVGPYTMAFADALKH